MPELPQELLECVIDGVAENSEREGCWLGADLFQCSRASRSLRPRCLVYIFSSIYIRGGGQEEWENRLIALLELIEDRPAIAKWIQELVLSTSDVEVENPMYPFIRQNRYPTTFGHPLFKRLMQVASPIRKVSIKRRHAAGQPSAVALEPLLTLPPVRSLESITSLSFEGLQQLPLSMIIWCHNLTSLELLDVQVQKLDEDKMFEESGVPVLLVSLKHLTIAYTTRSRSHLRPFFNSKYVNLSGLKSLTVYMEGIVLNLNEWTEFIKQEIPLKLCSRSLEELTLLSRNGQRGPGWIPMEHPMKELKSLRRLRAFYFETLYSKNMDHSSIILKYIRSNSLKKLTIEVSLLVSLDNGLEELDKLLNFDLDSFSMEILRIMASGSTFELRLACRVQAAAPLNDGVLYESRLRAKCYQLLAIIRRYHLKMLDNHPFVNLRMDKVRVVFLHSM
ncbi:hypothetical protein JR316_0011007 [Psilocybe cubensis]|uniref:Uncharacterized protein n=2 Tax=Psilocybe cubensis TaxID=181762 RepID=A0A8H7XNY0_PSICU|nr:hypothetical protein JR316_0011007 [Psilocybe cubensis]KAH9477091.1 hypothetical protein JR316_0011007 [Psilocybe cubensis]